MSCKDYYDFMIENEICTEDTLDCIISINGFTKETMFDVLYYYTGYRTIEQYMDYLKDII